MNGIPEATHQFQELFETDEVRVFRITFRHEDTFRLRCFSIVDPSIYVIADQWTALVVEPVSGKRPQFHKLFPPGSGIDFVESDITEIADDATGEVIYRSPD